MRISQCSHAEVASVVSVLERIWGAEPGAGPITAPMLHACVGTGACVLAARGAPDRLVGAAIAFVRSDDPRIGYLHVVGVDTSARGVGLGKALMHAVRAWALERGLHSLEWTFDPLVRRNARLYLRTLGARVVSYHRDLYGDLADEVNRGQGSDRVLVRWSLTQPKSATMAPAAPEALIFDCENEPRRAAPRSSFVMVELPPDIEQLRLHDPASASRWRSAFREVLGDSRHEVVAFDREDRYVLRLRAAA
jgi:predicted GNAT superfamily acetyltransferase